MERSKQGASAVVRTVGLTPVYTFLDGPLLSEDSDVYDEGFKPSEVRKGADLPLWLIQASARNGSENTSSTKSSRAPRSCSISTSRMSSFPVSTRRISSPHSLRRDTSTHLLAQKMTNDNIVPPKTTTENSTRAYAISPTCVIQRAPMPGDGKCNHVGKRWPHDHTRDDESESGHRPQVPTVERFRDGGLGAGMHRSVSA